MGRGDNPVRLLLRAVGVAAMLAAVPALAEEQVNDGTFSSADWDDVWWEDGPLAATLADGMMCTPVPGGTANSWDVGFGQDGLSLKEGVEYTFQFRASGTPKGRSARSCSCRTNHGPSSSSCRPRRRRDPQVFSTKFTAPETIEDAQLSFQIGGSEANWTFCVDDVSVDDDPSVAIAVVGPPSAGDANPQDTGSRVRVNQLGYLPNGPKHATIVTEATQPLVFVLKDEIGADVFTGMTTPRGFDPSAGLNVQVADFSGLQGRGRELHRRRRSRRRAFPSTSIPTSTISCGSMRSPISIPRDRASRSVAAIAGNGYGRPAGHLGKPGGAG